MDPRFRRALLGPLFLSLIPLLAGCPAGGGGSGRQVNIPTGLVATFSGATPTSGSVSMQPGPSTGTGVFQIQIAATDVNDLFSADLRIGYDPAVAIFRTFSSSDSLLNGSGVMTDFDATAAVAGTVTVRAARITALERRFDATAPASGSISLQPGAITGTLYEVLVTVTDVNNFFGAAFRLTFDPLIATFVSSDSSASLLNGAGIMTTFDASLLQAGELAVSAFRQQDMAQSVPGVNVSGSQTLIALTFRAIGTTNGSAFSLTTPREACSPLPGPCDPLSVSWQGGTFVNIAGTPGVDVSGTQELILLTFEAIDTATDSPFTFSGAQTICDSTLQPSCNPVSVNFLGGTLTTQ